MGRKREKKRHNHSQSKLAAGPGPNKASSVREGPSHMRPNNRKNHADADDRPQLDSSPMGEARLLQQQATTPSRRERKEKRNQNPISEERGVRK